MDIRNNPLGLVMNVVEEMGLEVTYAYDDLVFVAHNAFLIQMDQTPNQINLYFNEQSDQSTHDGIRAKLAQCAANNDLVLADKGFFRMAPGEDEQIELTFL